MKIALINIYFGYGSTGKGVRKNYVRLKNLGHEVKVFYGAKEQELDDENVVFFGDRYGRYFHMLCSKYLGLDGVMSNRATT